MPNKCYRNGGGSLILPLRLRCMGHDNNKVMKLLGGKQARVTDCEILYRLQDLISHRMSKLLILALFNNQFCTISYSQTIENFRVPSSKRVICMICQYYLKCYSVI